jgi:hypothetical protein
LNRECLRQLCNSQFIANITGIITAAWNFLQMFQCCIQRHGIFGSGNAAAPLRQVIFSKCSSAASNGMEFFPNNLLLHPCGKLLRCRETPS